MKDRLTTLPLELAIHILHQLRARDVVACTATCRRLRSIVDSDPHLQLVIELAVEGLRLREHPPALEAFSFRTKTPSERLEDFRNARLFQRHDAPSDTTRWRNAPLQGLEEAHSSLAVSPAEERGIALRSLWASPESPPWRQHRGLGLEILTFTFDLPQDLLVLVALPEEEGTDSDFGITIHLRSLLTGEPHIDATTPVLMINFTQITTEEKPAVSEEFLVSLHGFERGWGDLLIWNWKAGTILTRVSNAGGAIFLSSNILLYAVRENHTCSIYLHLKRITNHVTVPHFVQRILLHKFNDAASISFPHITGPHCEVDSPNLPDDLPLSPYIWDDPANSVVSIKFISQPYLIRTSPLLGQFKVDESQDVADKCYDQEHWPMDMIFRTCTKDFRRMYDIPTVVGSRMGFVMDFPIALGPNTMILNERGISQSGITGHFAILDFNCRPLLFNEARRQGNPQNDNQWRDAFQSGYIECHDGVKLRYRLVMPPTAFRDPMSCLSLNGWILGSSPLEHIFIVRPRSNM